MKATFHFNRRGYNSPVRRLVVAAVVALLALPAYSTAQAPTAAGESGQGAPRPGRALVYGGDREFPPYEYLNDRGEPEGFNIHLMRALAREAGMSVEIRLGQRDERMRDFDAGKTDVIVVGVDGTSDAIESIKSGRLTATVGQFPYLVGKRSVELLAEHFKDGKALDRYQATGQTVITKDALENNTDPMIKYLR